MMNKRKIAVFILTHGRADNVMTYTALRDHGYTGKIYLVIDDEDDQEPRYRELYGDKVQQFCKEEYLRKSMCINPDKPRKVILYARNACFDIAKRLGVTHFIEMDDDYNNFRFWFERDGILASKNITNLDRIIDAFFDFMEASKAKTVAFAQGGDLIGGTQSGAWKMQIKRKAMNSFFCRTDDPINFIGSINEDVNTYVTKGNRGELYFTIARVALNQGMTQQNSGGMTETYLDNGTYVKSFPTVMLNPSCTKIGMMGAGHQRMHHKINWKNAVPQILNERYRK